VKRAVHPGEVLREEYLKPRGATATHLANTLGVPVNRITQIVAGKRSITAETAILLARALGTTPEFWLNLQNAHDLAEAQR
jgi:antitoxin HigA-1